MSPLFWIFLVFGLILAASYAIAWWLAEHAPWRDEELELSDAELVGLRDELSELVRSLNEHTKTEEALLQQTKEQNAELERLAQVSEAELRTLKRLGGTS